MSNKKIEFTQEDWDFIGDYVDKVMESKGIDASLENQLGKKEPDVYDRQGYFGEYAIHKFFGVEMPDFIPIPTRKDMVLGYKGKELVCDIKSSIWRKDDGFDKYDVMPVWEQSINYNEWMHDLAEKGQTTRETKKGEEIPVVPVDAYIAVKVDWSDKDYREPKWAEIYGIITWEKFLKKQEDFAFPNGNTSPAVNTEEMMYLGNEFEYISS